MVFFGEQQRHRRIEWNVKIYLDGELEQSAYAAAIVNPSIKATPVIINASLENALGQLKLINRALDYKENNNLNLK